MDVERLIGKRKVAELLPFARTEDGEVEMAVPNFLRTMFESAKLPGKATRGEYISPERVTQAAMDLAGVGGGAGLALTPKGSLAMGASRASKDLPLDKASRMARAKEMGFDVDNPVYHGTGADFGVFDPSASGKMGGGVYTSESAKRASQYAGGGQGANVQKLFVKGRIAKLTDINEAREAAQRAIPRSSIESLRDWNAAARAKTQQILKEKGFSGMQIEDEILMLDPKNIRSVNAKFDPAMADSADLLAINPPSAAGFAIAPERDNIKPKGKWGEDFL